MKMSHQKKKKKNRHEDNSDNEKYLAIDDSTIVQYMCAMCVFVAMVKLSIKGLQMQFKLKSKVGTVRMQ